MNSCRDLRYLLASDIVEHLLKAVVCPLFSSFLAILSSFHITKNSPSLCPEFLAVEGLKFLESAGVVKFYENFFELK